MKVDVRSLTDEGQAKRDYRDVYTIIIDGKEVFSVWDGEPEDANLSRDFNDVLKIPDLMKRAYLAGLKGEGFSTVVEKVDDIE